MTKQPPSNWFQGSSDERIETFFKPNTEHPISQERDANFVVLSIRQDKEFSVSAGG
ncbi:MAG: hypothetical protein WKF87_11885 [Chryseolinea sp.]